MDLRIEVRLEILFQEGVDLIVARDNENLSCLQMDFLASVPGNPVLASSLKRMFHFLSASYDGFDSYRLICKMKGRLAKLPRASSKQEQFGCGLGMLLGHSLGSDDELPLGTTTFSWMGSAVKLLILVVSKNELIAFMSNQHSCI